MKNLDLVALNIPTDIKYIPDPDQRYKTIREWFKEKLDPKTLGAGGLVFKYDDKKFLIGFLSDNQWFFAGIPGTVRVINLNEFNPVNIWQDVFYGMNKARNISEDIAQIILYLYENKDTLFGWQNEVKIKQEAKRDVDVSPAVKSVKEKVK